MRSGKCRLTMSDCHSLSIWRRHSGRSLPKSAQAYHDNTIPDEFPSDLRARRYGSRAAHSRISLSRLGLAHPTALHNSLETHGGGGALGWSDAYRLEFNAGYLWRSAIGGHRPWPPAESGACHHAVYGRRLR